MHNKMLRTRVAYPNDHNCKAQNLMHGKVIRNLQAINSLLQITSQVLLHNNYYS